MGKHDDNSKLFWGIGGYLLGRLTTETNQRRCERDKSGDVGDVFAGLCVLIVLGITIFSVWSIRKHRFEFPEKQIVAIYYYGLAVPLKWIFSPWRHIYTESLTHYPNLNRVLAVGAIIIIIVVVIFIIRLFFRTLGKLAWSLLALFSIGPWSFWVVWEIYKWLFAQSK